MERVREQRPFCSLSKSQRERDRDCGRDKDRERRYTASSTDRDEGACRVPTQKSYSSSETLQAFDHDPSRMLFGGRVKEMAHMESAEYARAGQSSRRETEDKEAACTVSQLVLLWGQSCHHLWNMCQS